MLNTAQWASLARIVVMVAGAIAVGRGWATQEQVQAAASNADIIAIVSGILAIVVPAALALKARTKTAIVTAAAKVLASPDTKRIEVPDHLVNAIPSLKVVPVEAR